MIAANRKSRDPSQLDWSGSCLLLFYILTLGDLIMTIAPMRHKQQRLSELIII